jgi:hypothetical protein
MKIKSLETKKALENLQDKLINNYNKKLLEEE